MDNQKAQIVDMKARDIWLEVTSIVEMVSGAVFAMATAEARATADPRKLEALVEKGREMSMRVALAERDGDIMMTLVDNSVNPEYGGFRGPRPSARQVFADTKMFRKCRQFAKNAKTVYDASKEAFAFLIENDGASATADKLAAEINARVEGIKVMMGELSEMWDDRLSHKTFDKITGDNIKAALDMLTETKAMAEEISQTQPE